MLRPINCNSYAEVTVATYYQRGYVHLNMMLHPAHIPTVLPTSFTYAQARQHGLTDYRLRALVANNALVRLGRGIYRRANAPPTDESLLEVAQRAPGATLCLVTALARHALTDRIPDCIDVAIPRGHRPLRVQARVCWHRFDASTYHLGREVLVVDDGARIGL